MVSYWGHFSTGLSSRDTARYKRILYSNFVSFYYYNKSPYTLSYRNAKRNIIAAGGYVTNLYRSVSFMFYTYTPSYL